MVNPTELPLAAGPALSSLIDGELAPEACAQLLADATGEADTLARWHAYQLIGDVLRSEDLAAAPAHDQAFLRKLRGRLADEPVPLPLVDAAVQPPPRRAAARWLAPAALAAGVAALASVLVLTRVLAPAAADAPQLAQAAGGGAAQVAVGPVAGDPGIDRYLEAHRSLANGVLASGIAERRVQIVFEPK